MGCANSNNPPEQTKTRCGNCAVGKLTLKLTKIDLHTLKLKLESINHLNLFLNYGEDSLEGLGLWKFEQEPNLFEFQIPIHSCCQRQRRVLSVSIKNGETLNSAFGFLELDRFVNKKQKQSVQCFLNYSRGPAGKLQFQVNFQNIGEYQEFGFQIYQAIPRIPSLKSANYQINISIGQQMLVFNSMKGRKDNLKWDHQMLTARVPLDLVTEGKVRLFQVQQNKIEVIGQVGFTLSPFKDPENIVNKVEEKVTFIEEFKKRCPAKEGKDIKEIIAGSLTMFIAKKDKIKYLFEEPETPHDCYTKIRKRHYLREDKDSAILKKSTFNAESVSSNRKDSFTEESFHRRKSLGPIVSMPPLEVHKIVRNMSSRKRHLKQY